MKSISSLKHELCALFDEETKLPETAGNCRVFHNHQVVAETGKWDTPYLETPSNDGSVYETCLNVSICSSK